MVLMAAAMFTAAMLWAAFKEWDRPRPFFFHFALAESAVLGALVAQDLALFVMFFDLMLVPFYFLIGTWGVGERRVAATQARHLHACRLAPDARRGDRHGRDRQQGPRSELSRSPTLRR